MKLTMPLKFQRLSLMGKLTLSIIMTLVVTTMVVTIVINAIVNDMMVSESERVFDGVMKNTQLAIRLEMERIEKVGDDVLWDIEHDLEHADSAYSYLWEGLEKAPHAEGLYVAYAADLYPQYGRWFEPYVLRNNDGRFSKIQLAGQHQDYFKREWYTTAMKKRTNFWVDPYFNMAGDHNMIITYCMPVHDMKSNNRIVGILGIDLKLDWLAKLLQEIDHDIDKALADRASTNNPEGTYTFIAKHDGTYIIHPDMKQALRANFFDQIVEKKMTASESPLHSDFHKGKPGKVLVTIGGVKNYVYYTQLDFTGWMMAIVVPESELNSPAYFVAYVIIAIQLIGLIIIFLICIRGIRRASALTRAAFEKDLKTAYDIQMSMMPHPLPQNDLFDVDGHLTPAKSVGGDLYDFSLHDNKLFFCIGDVSGKGIPAALIMTMTLKIFRAVVFFEDKPSDIVSKMNDELCKDNEANMFVTLFVGVIDLTTGMMDYCNAGHEAPLIVTADDVNTLSVKPNIPVGLMPGMPFAAQQMQLQKNTTLFLYTDGLSEAENDLTQLFGHERITEAAQEARQAGLLEVKAFAEHMKQAVDRFVDGADQSDDLTLLTIQIK
jgi:hypothetical protein